MSLTLGAAAALGGMSALGSIGGGLLSSSGSAKAVKRQIAWERERAQNAHQWEVQDLKKAGLNPILSAGGQGAVTGSIDAVNTNEGIAQGTANAFNQLLSAYQVQMAEKKNNAEISNLNANTAQTMAMTPELIKTQRWNRTPHAVKELGGTFITASEIASDIFKTLEKKWNSTHLNAQQQKALDKLWEKGRLLPKFDLSKGTKK